MTTPEEQAAEVLATLHGFDLCNCWSFTARAQDARPEHEHTPTCRLTRIAAALAPLFAERERLAKAEALREAASDVVADCSSQPGPCICVARDWLRERADTYAEGGEQDG